MQIQPGVISSRFKNCIIIITVLQTLNLIISELMEPKTLLLQTAVELQGITKKIKKIPETPCREIKTKSTVEKIILAQ